MKEKIEAPLATIEVVPTGDTGISWDEIWAFIQRYYDAERQYVEELIRHHGSIALFRAPGDGSWPEIPTSSSTCAPIPGMRRATCWYAFAL